MDLQKHACNMYVTRLTVGSSPARAQLVDEHPRVWRVVERPNQQA